MIGSIIGGVASLAGSIFGGFAQAAKARKAKAAIEKNKQENQAWFNRAYNESATERADAQAALTELGKRLRESNSENAATAAVTGATAGTVASAKAKNADALADAVAKITEAGAHRKDEIEDKYRKANQDLDNQLLQVELGKYDAMSNAASGLANAVSAIGNSWDSFKLAKDALPQKIKTTSTPT